MLDNAQIKNADELEFAVFCIENIAKRLGKKRRRCLPFIDGKKRYSE